MPALSAFVPRLDAARFADQAARTKSVLHGHFLLMMAVYLLALGFSITHRNSAMSVASGQPPNNEDAPDMWRIKDGGSLAVTLFCFFAVTGSHAVIIGILLMKPIPGALMMSKTYSWMAPLAFYAVTMSYFITYTTSTRYGAGLGEWLIFGISSAVLSCVTVFCIVAPPSQEKVIKSSMPIPATQT